MVHLFNKGGWLGQGPGQKNFVDNLFSVPPSSTKSCPEQVPLLCYDSAQHTPPPRAAALVPCSHAFQVMALNLLWLAGLGQAAKQMT